MGRKRKQETRSPLVSEIFEQAKKFAESPTAREIGEQVRRFVESSAGKQLREFVMPPAMREVGERMPRRTYSVMASPSASLAVNSAETAKIVPAAAVVLERAGVTTGAVSDACPVTKKLAQVPHCVPSFALTVSVSAPVPAW